MSLLLLGVPCLCWGGDGEGGDGEPGEAAGALLTPSPSIAGVCPPQSQHRRHPQAALGKDTCRGDGQGCALLLDLCPQAWGYRGSGFPTDAPTFGAQPGASPDSRAALAGELEREGAQRRPSTQR